MTIPFLRASSHKVAARALCSETVLIFPLYYDAPADFSADIRVCVTCLMALWIVWVVELKINRGIFGNQKEPHLQGAGGVNFFSEQLLCKE